MKEAPYAVRSNYSLKVPGFNVVASLFSSQMGIGIQLSGIVARMTDDSIVGGLLMLV
jgi:hypothetical protein